GRSAEAAETARQGCAVLRRDGQFTDSGLTLLGNLVEPLISLGRLDEAAALLDEEAEQKATPLEIVFLHRLRADLALLRGDLPATHTHLTRAQALLRPHKAQDELPLAALTIQVAAREGRYADARAALAAVAAEGFPMGKSRYAWPVLLHGVAAEADARAVHQGADDGLLDRVRAEAAGLARGWPLAEGWALLVEAELLRAEGRADAGAYRAAADALE